MLIPTLSGGALASKLNVKTMLAEQIVDGVIIDSWSTVGQPEMEIKEATMESAESDFVVQPVVSEETPVEASVETPVSEVILESTPIETPVMEEISEPTPVETPVMEVVSEEASITEPTPPVVEEVPLVEVAPMADPVAPEAVIEDNKVNEKFKTFREKFLDREQQADAWENTIIEKMDRRIEKFKAFAQTLDGENDYLEEFKKEKLG